MKKLIIVLCLGVFLGGCGYLASIQGPNDVQLVLDPNAIGPWLDAAYATGQASQAIGLATGNPALVGGGILLATIVSIIGAGFLRKK